MVAFSTPLGKEKQRASGAGQHTGIFGKKKNPSIQDLDSRLRGGNHSNIPDSSVCTHAAHTHIYTWTQHSHACRQTHAYSFILTHTCAQVHSSQVRSNSTSASNAPWQKPNSANYLRPTFHPSHQQQLALHLDFLLLCRGEGTSQLLPLPNPGNAGFRGVLSKPVPTSGAAG